MRYNKTDFLLLLLLISTLCAGCVPLAQPSKPEPKIETLSFSPDIRYATYIYDGKLYIQAVHFPGVKSSFLKLIRKEPPGEALVPEPEHKKSDPKPPPEAKSQFVAAVPEGKLSWSADSRKLFFTSQEKGNWDLWTYDVTTKQKRRLTKHLGRDWAPRFIRKEVGGSPEAVSLWQNFLYFMSDRSGEDALWILNLDTKRLPPKKVCSITEKAAIAPDGRMFGFIKNTNLRMGVFVPPNKTLICRTAEKYVARVLTKLDNLTTMAFVGTGNTLAILSDGRLRIHVFEAGRQRYLTQDLGKANDFAVSPGGKTIMILSDSGIYSVNQEKHGAWIKRKAVFLLPANMQKRGPATISSLCFLPDRRRIAFAMAYPADEPATRRHIVILDLLSGQAESFSEEGPDASFIANFYFLTGEPEKATRILEKAIATEGLYFPETLSRIRRLLWRIYIVRDEISEAGKLAEHFNMYRKWGDVEFYFMRRFNAAKEAYSAAEKNGVKNIPELEILRDKTLRRHKRLLKHYTLGRKFEMQGNNKKALSSYHTAARYAWKKYKSIAAECFFRSGQISEKTNNPDDAVKYYETMPDSQPWQQLANAAKMKIFIKNPAKYDLQLRYEYRKLIESEKDQKQRLEYTITLVRLYFTHSANPGKALELIRDMHQRTQKTKQVSLESATVIRLYDIGRHHNTGTKLFETLCRQTILTRLSGRSTQVPLGPLMFESVSYLPWESVLSHDPVKIPPWFWKRFATYCKTLSPEKYAEEIRLSDALSQKRFLEGWHAAFDKYLKTAAKSPMYSTVATLMTAYLGSSFYKNGDWTNLLAILEKADLALGNKAIGNPDVLRRMLRDDPASFKKWAFIFFSNLVEPAKKGLPKKKLAWQKLNAMFQTDLIRASNNIVLLRKEFLHNFLVENPKSPLLDEGLFQYGKYIFANPASNKKDCKTAFRAFLKIVREYPESRRFRNAFRKVVETYRKEGRALKAYHLIEFLQPRQTNSINQIIMRLNKMDLYKKELSRLKLPEKEYNHLAASLHKMNKTELRTKLSSWEWKQAAKILGILNP